MQRATVIAAICTNGTPGAAVAREASWPARCMGISMEQIVSRILVVEDDPSVGRTVVEMLRCAGFAPILASTGDQARAALVAAHAFDAVLLDLQLGPERGELIIESVRECGATIPPVIVFSALPAGDTKAAAKRVGAAAVVEKTAKVTEIVKSIRLVASAGHSV